MSTYPQRLFAVVATCGSVFGLSAQSAAPDATDVAVRISREAAGLHRVDGELRGIGPDYRTDFSTEQVVFTPALGESAPRTYPWSVSFREIRRGDVVVATGAGLAAPQNEGRRVSYARATGVQERWDVRTDGIELTYVFERPLTGTGDLVVRLDVETDLVLQPNSSPESGARFIADGLGGVRVGGVTGIDAEGATAAGELRVRHDEIELVLPAAFVDAATYPLVLDPLIGTDFSLSARTVYHSHPDVAYDATHDEYLVVWEVKLAANDIAIHGQRLDGSGNPIGSMFPIRSAFNTAIHPTVANVTGAGRFMVAWQESTNIYGPWKLHAACVDAGTGVVSSDIVVAPLTGNDLRPNAGGESVAGQPDTALIVWEEKGAGIRASVVTCKPGAQPTAGSPITLSTDAGDSYPAISQKSGPQGHYLVAWSTPSGIGLALVDRTGAVLDTKTMTSVGFGLENVDLDGDGTDFIVAWDDVESGASFGERDTFFAKVTRSGSTLSWGAASSLLARPQFDERDPAVVFLGPKFALSWTHPTTPSPTSLTYDIGIQMVDPVTCADCGPTWYVNAGAFDGLPAMTRGNPDDDHGMLVFSSMVNNAPFSSGVSAQRMEAIGAGGTVTNVGGACGSPGQIGTNGPLALGNADFAFTLTGAEPTVSLALFVVGLPGVTIPCSPCQLLTPVASAPVGVAGGNATLPIPLRCDNTILGGTFEVQWWEVGTSSTLCSLLPTVSITDRLTATMGL